MEHKAKSRREKYQICTKNNDFLNFEFYNFDQYLIVDYVLCSLLNVPCSSYSTFFPIML